ncbi:hypothetical protein STENM327S_04216 [Streptomyces tendae]
MLRIFTAFSSSRSRESVAWVTVSPSSASSFASWLCERTACRLRMSTIRRWRAVRVCGRAGPAVCSCSCAWLIVVSFSGSSVPVGRVGGLVKDAGQRPEERVHHVVAEVHARASRRTTSGAGALTRIPAS